MKPYTNTIKQHIYTVTKLTSEIKTLLEETFPIIWITGEISNLSKPVSGHFYFTLKDRHSQISAVMFRNQNQRLTFMPESGMQVTGLGRIGVYEPRGTYQVIFEHLEPKGIGALQVAFEQLKAKLSEQGLFDDSHKKRLPAVPRKISIITSPTGAVIHDIIQIVCRRYPNVLLEVIPVKVQGDEAAQEITNAIILLNNRDDSDVAILARGGGSLEDLQAFNSEMVARALFSSKIPIISAVGHETDFTIADFVADLRAPTPSAAAELVVPNKQDLLKTCEMLTKQLQIGINQYLDHAKSHLSELSRKLIDPKKRIQDLRLKTDDLLARLSRVISQELQNKQERLTFQTRYLYSVSPLTTTKNSKEKLNQNYDNLTKSFDNFLSKYRHKLYELEGKLHALSPDAILKRGYSITRTFPEHQIVTDSGNVSIGENLEILLSKGSLNCVVEGKPNYAVKKDI